MKINFSNHMENLANRYGECEAIVNIERDRRYSFAEFHALTNRIVNMMTSLGLARISHRSPASLADCAGYRHYRSFAAEID